MLQWRMMAASKPSIADILRQDCKLLALQLQLEVVSARIEVQCLLQAVLNVNRAYLLTHPERVLDAAEAARYTELFQRRLKGEPVAYLLGSREFFGREFKVTSDTLIPRPDTELLVELALQKLPPVDFTHLTPLSSSEGEGGHKTGRGVRVLDMGTGTGAIALSIACERPDVSVVAVDASPAALSVAIENSQRFKAGNARFLLSDWFSQLEGEYFDLIVSNPPYIEDGDSHLSSGDVRFEPLSALTSGADGLDDIRRIVAGAKLHLQWGGWLMLEHGYDQAGRVRELLVLSGYSEVASMRDLAGIERVTMGRA